MLIIPDSRIFTKLAAEAYTISVSFADLLAASDTVSSCAVAATDTKFETNYSTGDDKVIGSTSATVSSPTASVKVQAGVAGRDYKIRFTATTTGGDTLIIDVLMAVR